MTNQGRGSAGQLRKIADALDAGTGDEVRADTLRETALQLEEMQQLLVKFVTLPWLQVLGAHYVMSCEQYAASGVAWTCICGESQRTEGSQVQRVLMGWASHALDASGISALLNEARSTL